MLVAWRVWYARNEITHVKPLPTIEGSKRFHSSYIKTLQEIKTISTEQILKGKQPLIYSNVASPFASVKEKPADKPWLKPPNGWVKLIIDGSFRTEDGAVGTGIFCSK